MALNERWKVEVIPPMTTPKEALERARAYVKPSHAGDVQADADLRAIDEALASLEGDTVERVARIIIGPRLPVPDNCQFTLEELRSVRWSQSTKAEQQDALSAARAILATGLVPDEAAIRAEPTETQISSACLSFRHDYGLLDDHDRERLRFVAVEWLRAWQKEGFGCDRDEVIERCAAIVDQCNREGPYEAIASAKRIRALKSAAIRSNRREA